MFRGDWFKFKNRTHHIDPQGDNDVTMYAYNGNVYYRIGRGQPHLIGGQTIINNYVQSESIVAANYRAGRETLATAGSHTITFDTPLGVDGTDLVLDFFVRDTSGAQPAFDVPVGDMTKYGFRVVTYDDNVIFGWKATLTTQ
jgi:hypothetical protein